MGGVILHPKCCCWRCSVLIHPNLSALRRESRRKETQPSSATLERMGLWYLDDHYPQPVRVSYLQLPQRPPLVCRRLDNIHSRLLQLLSYGVDVSHLQPQTYTLAGPSARGSQTAQGHLLRGRRPRSSWIRCPTSFNPVARSSPAYRGAFEGAPNVVVAEEQAFGAPGV